MTLRGFVWITGAVLSVLVWLAVFKGVLTLLDFSHRILTWGF